jgi:hypothetical protein
MTRRIYYRLHKWIAVGAGVFLCSWIVSGIVMILPDSAGGRPRPAAPEYRHAVLSPAQVAAAVGERPLEMALEPIGERIVYRVRTGRGSHLLDAASGRPFEITPSLAESIVRNQYAGGSAAMRVERLDAHRHGYGGPLPAYRLTVERSSTAYFVSLADGSVHRLTPVGRVRSAVESLHTFAVVPWLRGDSKARRVALFGAALTALAAALTGYFLALPKR